MSVSLVVEGPVARITLERPEVRNALGPAEWQRIGAYLAEIAAQPAVRVVVVRGSGGSFSAGGDVKTMPERLALEPAARRAQLAADAQSIRALREIGRPVVAWIDGACVGAGLGLALACDLRLASTRSSFGATFHRIGLTADFGLLHLLPRAVGPARATELLLLGEIVDAARAEAIGLVHRVHPPEQLEGEVEAVVRRLAEGPPVAMALTKSGLLRTDGMELGAVLEWEAAAQAIASRTEDAREGLAALAEKRPPRFQGR